MSATKDDVLKDANDQRKTLADFGVTYASDEWLAERGLAVVDKNYQTPVSADELLALQMAAIESKYQVKFAACEERLRKLLLTGGSADKMAELQAEYTALSGEKDAETLAILGGDL